MGVEVFFIELALSVIVFGLFWSGIVSEMLRIHDGRGEWIELFDLKKNKEVG